MERPTFRVLCLGLIVLLFTCGAEAKARPKAKPSKAKATAAQDTSATASSATTANPAPRPQESTVRRTFSFSPSDQPLNPQPSLFGFPGLWKAVGAESYPARSFGGTGWMDRINRDPGQLTITTTGAAGFVSLHPRFALSGYLAINRRILMRRADQISFGQERLAAYGYGGCLNCLPSNLTPVVAYPGQRIPLLRDPRTGVLQSSAGFYNLYPWVNQRSQNGVGELNIAGNINLLNTDEGHGIALGLRPWVNIPTQRTSGDEPLFSGRLMRNGVQIGDWAYGLDFAVEGHLRDILGTYFNVGFMRLESPENADRLLVGLKNNIPVRIGFNIPRTSRLQFLMEFTSDNFVGGATQNFAKNSITDGTAGFRAHFTDWFALSAGYRHTLNQWDGDKHGFVVQLSAAYMPVTEVPAPVPPTLSCTADRTTVRPGEQVTLTATASTTTGRPLTYVWSTTGGRLEGSGATARLDTTGLAPGTYSVTVRVDDGAGGFADCTVQITLEAPPPPPAPKAPTVTCRIDRTTVAPGEAVTVTASGSSPDNRSINYDWTVTGGRVEGSGPTVRWDTTGLSSGTYTATVRVTDDRGMSADCSVTLTIRVVEVPKAARLNTCNFKANSPRVDNVCKAVLDDVALRLQSEAESRAVVVGNKTARERNVNLAAQRASNVKAYLVRDKGVDAGRIEVRTGADDAGTVDIWLVPRGANAADVPGSPATEQPAAEPRARKKASAKKAVTTP